MFHGRGAPPPAPHPAGPAWAPLEGFAKLDNSHKQQLGESSFPEDQTWLRNRRNAPGSEQFPLQRGVLVSFDDSLRDASSMENMLASSTVGWASQLKLYEIPWPASLSVVVVQPPLFAEPPETGSGSFFRCV